MALVHIEIFSPIINLLNCTCQTFGRDPLLSKDIVVNWFHFNEHHLPNTRV